MSYAAVYKHVALFASCMKSIKLLWGLFLPLTNLLISFHQQSSVLLHQGTTFIHLQLSSLCNWLSSWLHPLHNIPSWATFEVLYSSGDFFNISQNMHSKAPVASQMKRPTKWSTTTPHKFHILHNTQIPSFYCESWYNEVAHLIPWGALRERPFTPEGTIQLLYSDKIIIFAECIHQMLDRTELVLQRLKSFNFKIEPKKCHFFQRTVVTGRFLSLKGNFATWRYSSLMLSCTMWESSCIRIIPEKGMKKVYSYAKLILVQKKDSHMEFWKSWKDRKS